jgi:6-phosphogluconate dehydrogenase
MLKNLTQAYLDQPALPNTLLAPYFRQKLELYTPAWRQIVAQAVLAGIPVPAFSAALGYYDAYRTACLPANLVQAQRDYFGSHTYRRTDRDGSFHTEWQP